MTRALQIHSARVFLAEAARRRSFNGMHANLLLWAANARKRAMVPAPSTDQPDLFSVAPAVLLQHRSGEG